MKILLLSQNATDKTFLSEVSTKLGLSFLHAEDIQIIVAELKNDPAALLFIDASSQKLYAAFENAMSDNFGLYSTIINPNSIFFISSQPLYANPYLVSSQILGNFFVRNYHPEDKEIFSMVLKRLMGETTFGIENYFSPMAKQQLSQIKRSIDKTAAIEGLRNYLKRWGMNSRASGYVATCVDELLLHALYDAPVDQLGAQLYANIPRNTPLDLVEGSYIDIKVVHDNSSLGVSILDKFGTMDRGKFFNYLGKSYRQEDYKNKNTISGLDLGLSSVLHFSSGFIMSWETGVKCEMMVFFRKSFSFREYRDQFRFVCTQQMGA